MSSVFYLPQHRTSSSRHPSALFRAIRINRRLSSYLWKLILESLGLPTRGSNPGPSVQQAWHSATRPLNYLQYTCQCHKNTTKTTYILHAHINCCHTTHLFYVQYTHVLQDVLHINYSRNRSSWPRNRSAHTAEILAWGGIPRILSTPWKYNKQRH